MTKDDYRIIRCSALPSLMRCSARLEIEAPDIDPGNDEATLGTACHAAMRLILQGEQRIQTQTIAQTFGIPEKAEELKALVTMFYGIWKKHIEPAFRGRPIVCEREIVLPIAKTGWALSGHIDVSDEEPYEADDGVMCMDIVDWKSGRVESDHDAQVRGYALQIMAKFPKVQRVNAIVVYGRSGNFHAIQVTRKDALLFHNEVIIGRMLQDRETFKPGEACVYCPKSHACTGRKQLVRSALDEISTERASGTWQSNLEAMAEALDNPAKRAEMGPAIGELWERRKAITRAVADFEKVVKLNIDTHGALPVSDTHELRATEIEKRSYDPVVIWDIVSTLTPDLAEKPMSETQFHSCIRVVNSDLDATLRAIARKRGGKRLIDHVKGAAEEVGGIFIKNEKRYELTKRKAEDDNGETDRDPTGEAGAGEEAPREG